MRARLLLVTLALVVPAVPATAGTEHRHGSVYARVTDGEVVLGNSVTERRWSRSALRTTALVDKRGRDRVVSAGSRDFALNVAAADVLGSEAFRVSSVSVDRLERGGLRVTMALSGVPGIAATRVVEAYGGIAGFRTQTVLTPTVPLVLRGATLDEVVVPAAAPTLHALRAGADWRDPSYTGPQFTLGDPHAGTWRDTKTAPAGTPLAGAGQWLSLAAADGRTAFLVAERNDLPSSRASYDGTAGRLVVDWSRDVISLGPLEENGHAENPGDGPARQRVLAPGVPFALDAAFTGLGANAADEAWQVAKYLRDHRLAPYAHDVVFNSNGTDANVISTGAKDDMNYAAVLDAAPIAKRLGIETFVLDDGWQAISGDWFPDSPEHPEPRWDGVAGSKFAPRFPDSTFAAVREAIAPMKLGLWMSPMHFHPESATFKAHPEWACTPTGTATAGANVLDPESSSNEAGIGTWGPLAIPHVESRIRTAITEWQVSYFKFDFLVWLDCAGQGTLHDYQEAFVAMLDRLRADHPDVTFQIDETNDYRLFPYASVSRGPSWFQNGTPTPTNLLHNLWNLAPYVPTESLGQHFLGGRQYRDYPVSTLMAAALLSHPTFFSELRSLPSEVVDEAAPWTAFRARYRDLLTEGVTYPLLADPLAGGWTALQTWDPDRARGALVAFRQKDAAATRTVPLVGVPVGRRFYVYAAPDGAYVATVTSAQLTAGLPVTLPEDGAAAYVIVGQ
ncbi:MAG TPA: alpha-galactosidase [Frankiaceae bacterium]|nr:alpha-galactosidase [Frankiaceae bacterium]